jgi:hypothetical protein
MSHTPGPWVVHPKFRSPVIGYDIGDGETPLPIVDVVHGYDTKQARANARLIAAAPELLHELKRLLAAYRDAVRLGYSEDDAYTVGPHNAIAKAEQQ